MALNKETTGTLLVLLTALSSGIAIFLNKYAIANFSNAFLFTFLKNAVVAVVLFGFCALLLKRASFSKISFSNWKQLALIGFIGGGAAFALYFFALQNAQALTAGLLHKTLFVWAGLLGLFILKEKMDSKFLIAAGLIIVGNFLLFNGALSFGLSEALILIAVLLWSIENLLAKRLMNSNPGLSGLQVGFGRMFFGALFLLGFLLLTGNFNEIGSLSLDHIQWLLITSAFLVVYVATFYKGLQFIPLHKATALLAFGQPVTAFLAFMFLGKTPLLTEATGLFFLVIGTGLIAYYSLTNRKTISRVSSSHTG